MLPNEDESLYSVMQCSGDWRHFNGNFLSFSYRTDIGFPWDRSLTWEYEKWSRTCRFRLLEHERKWPGPRFYCLMTNTPTKDRRTTGSPLENESCRQHFVNYYTFELNRLESSFKWFLFEGSNVILIVTNFNVQLLVSHFKSNEQLQGKQGQ